MARVCVRHPFQPSDNLCDHCGLEFCRDCLVYPRGARKRALCVSCALAASGVRARAANRPAMSRRELRRRLKEREAEMKALARLEREPEPIPPISNPFTPGWAVADDLPSISADEPVSTSVTASARAEPPRPAEAAPPAVTLPTLPPPPPPPAAAGGRETIVADAAPTLADLLPPPPAADQPAPEPTNPAPERRLRSLPLLRRREEPEDDGREASEMIAWLDEVFAPRDPDR